MPFGLYGAPALFQHMMDRLLADRTEFAAAYLDDVVIYSTTREDFVAHIDNVLRKLSGRAHAQTKELPVRDEQLCIPGARGQEW